MDSPLNSRHLSAKSIQIGPVEVSQLLVYTGSYGALSIHLSITLYGGYMIVICNLEAYHTETSLISPG